jgi:hypothetical protein
MQHNAHRTKEEREVTAKVTDLVVTIHSIIVSSYLKFFHSLSSIVLKSTVNSSCEEYMPMQS